LLIRADRNPSGGCDCDGFLALINIFQITFEHSTIHYATVNATASRFV